MSAPPLGYRAVSAALALPFAGYTLVRTLRDGDARYARERLGLAPRFAQRPLWIHCASVGEVVTALPLVTALDAEGAGPLVISTNTPTGRAVAEARAPAGVYCIQAPLDRPASVRRFFARVSPRAGVILETELWPWLFAAAAARGVPLAIVNGRLSRRTRDAPGWLRASAAFCLARVAAVLARSEDDAAAFRALGAAPDRVRTIGNLKLAAPGTAPVSSESLGQPYVLAASTHHDEESQLAQHWRASGCETLLVIAPRHPERGARIAEQLRREGWRVARRSQKDALAPDTDLYLADTLGELPALIAGAELVIMGGSLIEHGGQNVLEPARAGRAVVTGPHMENFSEETAALREAGALRQCADAAEVVATTVELLGDSTQRRAMGGRASHVLEAGADIALRYHDALVDVLGDALRAESGSTATHCNADRYERMGPEQ
ncbi:MAG: glycosyltransferase N-terminal domain-containing protein [Halofilum sp. (in: g-proteobacteria)]